MYNVVKLARKVSVKVKIDINEIFSVTTFLDYNKCYNNFSPDVYIIIPRTNIKFEYENHKYLFCLFFSMDSKDRVHGSVL